MNETEAKQTFPWGHLALALLLLALLRLPSLDLPLDRDEGEYATLAWAWMHGLGIPYRDFLEQKAPLAVFAYMAAFFSGGESPGAVRFFALLWQLCSAGALFALAFRVTRRPLAALGAAALFACLSASALTQGLGANTELFCTLPMLGAVGVLHYGRGRGHWFAAGAFIGLAGLFKQSALPALLILPLAMPGPWRQRLGHAGDTVAGAAAPWLLCLLGFACLGAGSDFWRCVVGYNMEYAGQGLRAQFGNLAAALWSLGREDWALWLALLLGGFSAAKGRSPGMRLFWAWLLAAFAGIALSGRYYPHYFQVLAGPMALLAGAWALEGGLRWRRLLLPGIFVLAFVARNSPLWAAADGGQRSRMLYGLPDFARAPQAAEALRSLTPEGSRILVWGSEAELYFLSRRRPATRFLFNYPFTGEAPAWPGGDDELLHAMGDPSTSAVVLASPLDRSDALQRRLGAILQKQYELRVDLAPDTLIGLRKK